MSWPAPPLSDPTHMPAPSDALGVQTGYNLIYWLWKYDFDADCDLFLKILKGDVREDVYTAQRDLQVSPCLTPPLSMTPVSHRNTSQLCTPALAAQSCSMIASVALCAVSLQKSGGGSRVRQ